MPSMITLETAIIFWPSWDIAIEFHTPTGQLVWVHVAPPSVDTYINPVSLCVGISALEAAITNPFWDIAMAYQLYAPTIPANPFADEKVVETFGGRADCGSK